MSKQLSTAVNFTSPTTKPVRLLSLICLCSLFLGSCSTINELRWKTEYGSSKVVTRERLVIPEEQVDYWTQVKPIVESRCVSCHACFDASCQLKMTSIEGIDRGASKEQVYQTSRLFAASPTRLHIDAQSTQQWRKKAFFPVLNEHKQTAEMNKTAGLVYRFLELKEQHPLPEGDFLPEQLTLGLYRGDVCPSASEFDQYAKANPLWGMPYALPALSAQEQSTLKRWLEQGAVYTPRQPLGDEYQGYIDQWEALLNQDSNKAQLSARYLYEHLFISHLYFPELSDTTYFNIIRSSTPPGVAPDIIASRRPYDDPKVSRVYYRLVPELETVVDKTHNPYAMGLERMQRFKELFFDATFNVSALPGYSLPDTANPFKTYDELPLKSRYSFLIDDSQSIIMQFIKGSVCRGQVAVNVVRDHFWVFFLEPDSHLLDTVATYIDGGYDELALANGTADGDTLVPLGEWRKYAKLEKQKRKYRDIFMSRYFADNPLNLDLVWDGDGTNANASLTVFRHNDSATVEQGLLGNTPQTAWFIDYTLLERIHSLLVAGYDVYGALGHQLISRLHMDFLRMEGETNIINFLPKASRNEVRRQWYRQASDDTIGYLSNTEFDRLIEPDISYTSDDPLQELMMMLKQRVIDTVPTHRDYRLLESPQVVKTLERLESFKGWATQLLPEMSVIKINGETDHYVTLLRNNAHINMSSLFSEGKRKIPAENTVSVLNGVIGSYPNAFWSIPEGHLDLFVDAMLTMNDEADYKRARDQYGIRRTNAQFWDYSDVLHNYLKNDNPTVYGLLDYNRLENR